MIFGGMMSRKTLAAFLAASIRLGATSVAIIDSDVSMARMTVARSRGTFSSRAGRARATTMQASPSTRAMAGRWRRHPGCFGATLRSRSRLVKRTAYSRRRTWSPM